MNTLGSQSKLRVWKSPGFLVAFTIHWHISCYIFLCVKGT